MSTDKSEPPPPPPPTGYRAEGSSVPARDHLKDRKVRLTLNPWAKPGPIEGVFAGQGERGLTLIVPGGGRFIYLHHEVAEVTPA